MFGSVCVGWIWTKGKTHEFISQKPETNSDIFKKSRFKFYGNSLTMYNGIVFRKNSQPYPLIEI